MLRAGTSLIEDSEHRLDCYLHYREDPKAAEWLHWLVVNIPGDKIKMGDIELGKVLMQHNGPSPPKRSGKSSYST